MHRGCRAAGCSAPDLLDLFEFGFRPRRVAYAGESLAQAEVVTVKHTIERKTTKANLNSGAILRYMKVNRSPNHLMATRGAILLEV